MKILFHCCDIAKVNAWLLYRRHFEIKNISKKQQMKLLTFCQKIIEGLLECGKEAHKRSVGRPSKRSLEEAQQVASKRGRKLDQKPLVLMFSLTQLITGKNTEIPRAGVLIARKGTLGSDVKNAVSIFV